MKKAEDKWLKIGQAIESLKAFRSRKFDDNRTLNDQITDKLPFNVEDMPNSLKRYAFDPLQNISEHLPSPDTRFAERPVVGLLGFQSAGKTALMRDLCVDSSHWRELFVSSDQDTTSPIVRVRLGEEDSPNLDVRFFTAEKFGELWDDTVAGQPAEYKSRLDSLKKAFLSALKYLGGKSYSIPIRQSSEYTTRHIALLCLIKDYTLIHRGETAPVLAARKVVEHALGSDLPRLEDLSAKIKGLNWDGGVAKGIRQSVDTLGSCWLLSILIAEASITVKAISNIKETEFLEFELVDVPGLKEKKVSGDDLGCLLPWQASRNHYYVRDIATREFDLILLCASAGEDEGGELTELCQLLGTKSREWVDKRVLVLHTLLDKAFQRTYFSNTFRLSNKKHDGHRELAQAIYNFVIGSDKLGERLEYHSLPFQAMSFLDTNERNASFAIHYQASLGQPNSVAKEIQSQVPNIIDVLAQIGRARLQCTSRYVKVLSEALITAGSSDPDELKSHKQFPFEFLNALSEFVTMNAIEAALHRCGLRVDLLKDSIDSYRVHEALVFGTELDPRLAFNNMEPALRKSQKFISASADTDDQMDWADLEHAWIAVWESHIPEAEAKAWKEWLTISSTMHEAIESAYRSFERIIR